MWHDQTNYTDDDDDDDDADEMRWGGGADGHEWGVDGWYSLWMDVYVCLCFAVCIVYMLIEFLLKFSKLKVERKFVNRYFTFAFVSLCVICKLFFFLFALFIFVLKINIK